LVLWALDFAGGTVVHINAGVAGFVLARVVGKRIGYGKEAMFPSSITLTSLGAALLWFGWFGFNAGSELAADGVAGSAFLVTNTPASTAALALLSRLPVLSPEVSVWIKKVKLQASTIPCTVSGYLRYSLWPPSTRISFPMYGRRFMIRIILT